MLLRKRQEELNSMRESEALEGASAVKRVPLADAENGPSNLALCLGVAGTLVFAGACAILIITNFKSDPSAEPMWQHGEHGH